MVLIHQKTVFLTPLAQEIFFIFCIDKDHRTRIVQGMKALKDSDFFISLGAISHIFGPRWDTDSVPWQTEFTLLLLNKLLLRRL